MNGTPFQMRAFIPLCLLVAGCAGDDAPPIEPPEPPPPAGALDIWRDTATIAVGEEIIPPFSVWDEGGAAMDVDVVEWSSTDSSVVAVDDGIIVALAPGSAEVVARAHPVEDRITIRVPAITSIRLTPGSDSLLAGERRAFDVDIEADIPFDPSIDRLHWSLDSRAFASLHAPGVVQSLRAGEVALRVAIGGVSAQADVRIFALRGAFIDIAATATSTCALREPGIPYCWGSGLMSGVVDNASYWGADEPLPVPHDPDGLRFDALEAEGSTICGLADGEVWCWGDNRFAGFFGPGAERRMYSLPYRIDTELRFQAITIGTSHMCGLDADGVAWCWGALNDAGQLGNGTVAGRIEPAPVAGDHRFTRITAGGNHSCGITTSGDVLCWGENSEGAVPGGADPCEWSFNGGPCAFEPLPVAGLPSARQLASGGLFGMDLRSCIIGADDGLYCWGGPLGEVHRVDERAYASVSLGEDHGCALAADGAAYCFGSNENGELASTRPGFADSPAPVYGDWRFAQIATGGNHTCGITDDRVEIFCWGANNRGQLGTGTGILDPVGIPQKVRIP